MIAQGDTRVNVNSTKSKSGEPCCGELLIDCEENPYEKSSQMVGESLPMRYQVGSVSRENIHSTHSRAFQSMLKIHTKWRLSLAPESFLLFPQIALQKSIPSSNAMTKIICENFSHSAANFSS